MAQVARARRSSEIGRGEPCAPDTPAILTFTSGSTGDPKAVVRSHGFLIAQHHALANSLAFESGDTDLTALPIVLLANLASGITSIIPDADLRAPGAIRPEPVLDQIRRLRPSRTIASPALLERLAACAARRGGRSPTASSESSPVGRRCSRLCSIVSRPLRPVPRSCPFMDRRRRNPSR